MRSSHLMECPSLFSFELPRSNQYWKSRDLQNFLRKARKWHIRVNVMLVQWDWKTQSGLRIGKVFRIQSSNSCLSQRLNSRFQCRCNESHAPFNAVDYHDTERYSMKFARFLVKSFLHLCILEVRTQAEQPPG